MDMRQFVGQVRERLHGHGYSDLAPIAPLAAAFVKPSPFGTSVIAITDGRNTTDTAMEHFERVRAWFNGLVGNGRGLFLFVYSNPPYTTVQDIQKAKFYTGSAGIDAGFYDLVTGTHWLSYSQFEQDVFGE
jgi:hypothetical protein